MYQRKKAITMPISPSRCSATVRNQPLGVALQPPVPFWGSNDMDHVCIFIDGSNFYHALKEANLPVDINFAELAAALVGPERRHMQTFYHNTPLVRPAPGDPDYDARESRYRRQQNLFNALRYVPNLTLKLGRFQRIRGEGQEAVCPSYGHSFQLAGTATFVEKSVDVMLATDVLLHATKNHYDVAVLISSDADYKHAVEKAKLEFNKAVELRQIESARCYDLTSVGSRYEPITGDLIRSCSRPWATRRPLRVPAWSRGF